MNDFIEQLKTSNLLENNNEILYSLLDDEKLKVISENMPTFYTYGKNLDSTAYISWRFNFSYEKENDFDIMSNAYFECALELINKCIEDNKDKKLDIWIFPILYNISHSLELKLKSIYLYIQKKLEPSKTNHNWIDLIRDIKGYYIQENQKEMSFKKKMNEQFILSLEIAEHFLECLLSKSEDVTFIRYPVDKKNNEFFYNKSEENVVIDLILLRNEFILSYYLLNFIVEMNVEESSNVN